MKIIIQNGISSVRALFPPLRRAPRAIIPHPSSLALDIRVTFINNYLFFYTRRRNFSTFIEFANNTRCNFAVYMLRDVRHDSYRVARATKNSADKSLSEVSETSVLSHKAFLSLLITQVHFVFTYLRARYYPRRRHGSFDATDTAVMHMNR